MPLAPARLLDLTRLVSRLGRGVLTGIDRVELAYLERLLADPLPVFALVRTGPGFVLLDRAGACAVAQRAKGALPVGAADFLGWLTRRTEPLRARAEADLRRLALARAAPPLLGRMLRRHLPAGVSYINVGHANLTARVMRAVQTVPGARTAVLVHDVIPLDFPEFTRPGISAVFAHKMAVVAKYADLVICSTEDAKRRVHAQLARLDPAPSAVVPLIVVMALGVPEPHPDKAALPAGLNLAAPYFVIIGTIEPRKNHALL
ncbi:MAG: glycosyltransferase family 1 protein, partial [Paracoccaceae bacterium]|nr:glycosyltransferase family 1 protein [Paracoccaceae bacterium]